MTWVLTACGEGMMFAYSVWTVMYIWFLCNTYDALIVEKKKRATRSSETRYVLKIINLPNQSHPLSHIKCGIYSHILLVYTYMLFSFPFFPSTTTFCYTYCALVFFIMKHVWISLLVSSDSYVLHNSCIITSNTALPQII